MALAVSVMSVCRIQIKQFPGIWGLIP